MSELTFHMKCFSFLFCLLFISCSVQKHTFKTDDEAYLQKIEVLYDKARNREVPVALYQTKNGDIQNKIPIFFSHGYALNSGDAFVNDYNYLTDYLAEKGYFVVSIQHELKTDELLKTEGKPQIVRRPNWERGAENIDFVLKKIKKKFPNLKYDKLVLIGHSNGGDISALYAGLHPEKVSKLIALDNRRMAFPRLSKPKSFTIRSVDFEADEGVLPSEEEQKKLGMTVIFSNIKHNQMDDDASPEERIFMTSKILEFLKK